VEVDIYDQQIDVTDRLDSNADKAWSRNLLQKTVALFLTRDSHVVIIIIIMSDF